MKSTLLVGSLGLLLVGSVPAASFAQAKAPLTQPNSEAAAIVPAGELALGTVKVPKGLKADGKPLAAGTYKVRLTTTEAESKAAGATPSYERYVEFLQGTEVKGREVVSIVPNADIGKVAKGKGPAPGASRTERLRGDDYVRVWINRGGNHYLIHLAAG
jgi:hypothetical protein